MEDNPTDIYVIRKVLESCELDIQICVARDGQEALTFLEESASAGSPCPALVLLDLNIPKVTGIEVLRQLRASDRCAQTLVIIVTSSTAAIDRADAERLHADAYFQKPRTLAAYMDLAELVKQFFSRPDLPPPS